MPAETPAAEVPVEPVELPADWAELSVLIRTTHELVVVIDQRSLDNEVRIGALEDRPNTPGENGNDATIDIDAITAAVLERIPSIDTAAIEAIDDEAIEALAKRLPPLTFQAWLDGKKWGEPMPYSLGETVGVDSKLLNPTNFPVGDKE